MYTSYYEIIRLDVPALNLEHGAPEDRSTAHAKGFVGLAIRAIDPESSFEITSDF